MKVSRKLGRRKHSRSSFVSRRRFRNKKSRSGYKKRYAKTQRGGARSRKYGHKRGKRFHRGGENEFNCEEFKKNIIKVGERNHSIYDIYYNNHHNYKNHKFELTFKKIDLFSFTQGTEKFALKVDLKDLSPTTRNMVIVLERLTGGGSVQPSFMFEGQLANILDTFVKPETWENIPENGDNNLGRTYNFNFDSNLKIFKQIVDCLKVVRDELWHVRIDELILPT